MPCSAWQSKNAIIIYDGQKVEITICRETGMIFIAENGQEISRFSISSEHKKMREALMSEIDRLKSSLMIAHFCLFVVVSCVVLSTFLN